MFVKQDGNAVAGDLVAGNKNVVNITHTNKIDELNSLYEKLKSNPDEDNPDGSFCEQLEHYMSAKTKGDVRGLEEKLSESGRLDLLDYATELKERATKSIMRHQTSRTAQRIYTIVLDDLHTGFMLSVTPLIQADASRADVESQTHHVLQSVRSALGDNALGFTLKDLNGLLYFLGGNCHIRWDKC